ncbi:hypothetical protein [Shewanella surugensis]|uniref:Cytochrome C n=1 Tax=Shewanella surugensis TaxID=212020 RepID=A0ABT0LAP5_9GAMM|nr:hypothetical protein [Shewanella surugensis]MCL1124747.1 hypothetical protein [Shewanella surugensis]
MDDCIQIIFKRVEKNTDHISLAIGFSVVLVFCLMMIPLEAKEEAIASKHWITEMETNTERFERIERYLRGFDQTMWEVGERYEKLYQALKDDNFDLALYHWAKIKVTIENGLMKRPARKMNAEAIFLSTTWPDVNSAFNSKNNTKAWKGFFKARSACMACHFAEKVSFINDQPMFYDSQLK